MFGDLFGYRNWLGKGRDASRNPAVTTEDLLAPDSICGGLLVQYS